MKQYVETDRNLRTWLVRSDVEPPAGTKNMVRGSQSFAGLRCRIVNWAVIKILRSQDSSDSHWQAERDVNRELPVEHLFV